MYCQLKKQCLGCAKKLVQAGVKEVVYSEDYGMDSLTAQLLEEGGVKLRKHRVVKVSA